MGKRKTAVLIGTAVLVLLLGGCGEPEFNMGTVYEGGAIMVDAGNNKVYRIAENKKTELTEVNQRDFVYVSANTDGSHVLLVSQNAVGILTPQGYNLADAALFGTDGELETGRMSSNGKYAAVLQSNRHDDTVVLYCFNETAELLWQSEFELDYRDVPESFLTVTDEGRVLLLAMRDADSLLLCFDRQGQKLAERAVPGYLPRFVDFLADGNTIVAGCNASGRHEGGVIFLYDVQTQKLRSFDTDQFIIGGGLLENDTIVTFQALPADKNNTPLEWKGSIVAFNIKGEILWQIDEVIVPIRSMHKYPGGQGKGYLDSDAILAVAPDRSLFVIATGSTFDSQIVRVFTTAGDEVAQFDAGKPPRGLINAGQYGPAVANDGSVWYGKYFRRQD